MSFNVGVVGCGGMGVSHAKAYRADGRVRDIYLADVVEDRAKRLAEEVGARSYYMDYRALLKNPEIHAVSIVTPHDLHAKMAVEFAEAGKHVLCEKPMALTVEECEEMISASREAKVILAVGFVLRFFKVLQEARKVVRSGGLGDVKHAYVMRFGGPFFRQTRWMGERGRCGGLVLSVNCHEVDMLRWLMGEVEEARAEAARLFYDEIDYEDNALVFFKFKSGAIGFLGSSISSYIGIYEYYLLGAEGTMRVRPWEGLLTKIGKAGGREERVIKDEVPPINKEVSCFLECIERGEVVEPMASGEDGLKATAIIKMAMGRLNLPER